MCNTLLPSSSISCSCCCLESTVDLLTWYFARLVMLTSILLLFYSWPALLESARFSFLLFFFLPFSSFFFPFIPLTWPYGQCESKESSVSNSRILFSLPSSLPFRVCACVSLSLFSYFLVYYTLEDGQMDRSFWISSAVYFDPNRLLGQC